MTDRPAGLLRLAAVAGLIIVGLATGDGGGETPAEPARPVAERRTPASAVGSPETYAPSTKPTAAPVGTATPAAGVADPAPTAPDPVEVEAARSVAGAFAAGYATHRYDDPPDALVGRLAPYASPELLDRLRQASGAQAARRDIEASQRVATAEVEALITEHAAPERVVVLVAIRQTVAEAGGQRLHRPVYRLTLQPGPAGWQVTAVDR